MININNSLITGGSGMLGSHINFGLKPTSSEMDVTDINSINNYILNIKENISCIIHLVASNLRESEENHKKSINTNINGTTNMLSIAMKYDIPFILLSTGAVFSSFNNNMKFDEKHKTNPNCMYGYTKAASENIALLYNKSIIIRTGWLFGGNQKTHYKFVEHVINNLLINNEVKASNNFYGSPTYVNDLIEHMIKLISNNNYGIHHIVNNGIASGYDIALEIAEYLKKDKMLVQSVTSDLVPNAGPIRSYTEILETIHDSNRLRDWQVALKEYIELYLLKKNISLDTNIVLQDKKWSNRTQCRLCNSYDLYIFFKLEPTPPANHFVLEPDKQEKIPLDICMCVNCKHIQLIQKVDPSYQYTNYLYVSSTSYTMTNHLQNSVIEFTNLLNLSKTDNILEIGANDGVCVKHLLDNGFVNIIGVDPASNINKRHKLPIICDFFGSNILSKLSKSFKLIYAFHCCAHIEDIQDVFQTIYKLLDQEGVFIMEVGYFYEVYRNKLFDVIYHEHIDYHTCTAIQHFGLQNNLKLYKVNQNDIQGGSIQFYFSKNNDIKIENSVIDILNKEQEYELFNINKLLKWQNPIIQSGKDINNILNSFISYGKTIVGYGASAKSTTFLHQYKLSNKTIKYIIDDNIYKQNYYTPGLHIPIKASNMLDIDKIDYIIILSWNFTDEIVKKLDKYRMNGLRIIVPFPEIRIM
jgi:dTDP-4-dehydrorhamnose reductase